MSTRFRLAGALTALALVLAAALPARCGWWIFGKAGGRPQLLRTYIGGVEVGQRGDEKVDLYRGQLREGRLEVKGFYRSAGAMVAQAKISLDGGATWDENLELAKDSFLYSFTPQPEQVYRLKLNIVDAAGQENDPGDLPKISFVYHPVSGETIAEQGLRDLAQRYSSRDYGGFSSLIAEDYQGDAGSLEDAVARDFKTFSSINLGVIPSRTLLQGADAKIDFRFDETVVRSTDSSTSRSSGLATYTLRLEDGKYKLFQMPSPVLFGVTAPAGENPHSSGGSGGVQQGSAQMTSASPFDFARGANVAGGSGDVAASPDGSGVMPVSPAGVKDLGPVALNNVGVAPASGYSSSPVSVSVGDTCAVVTRSGTYALFQITSMQMGLPSVMKFNYLYQPNGTRDFSQ